MYTSQRRFAELNNLALLYVLHKDTKHEITRTHTRMHTNADLLDVLPGICTCGVFHFRPPPLETPPVYHTRPLTPLSRTRTPSRPHRYQSQGTVEETQIILLEALRGMRERLPEDHLDISRGLCNLAKFYETTSETLGLQAEAEPLYLESLAMMVCE